MSKNPEFNSLPELRLLSSTEMQDALARSRRMQAQAIVGYFSAVRGRFRRGSSGRTTR